MAHTAEIIAVGTELLLGNIANTNAQMLSQSLSCLGINVFWHTVVGDNPQRLKEALDIARGRADILLTIGGLGPTYDDLTKQTICEAFGQRLVLHALVLDDGMLPPLPSAEERLARFICRRQEGAVRAVWSAGRRAL